MKRSKTLLQKFKFEVICISTAILSQVLASYQMVGLSMFTGFISGLSLVFAFNSWDQQLRKRTSK